jgi:hypothetical protein
MIYWKITKDHLYDGEYFKDSREGVKAGNPDHGNFAIIKFRAYDDDDELYYEGEVFDNEESLESVFDWTQKDAGVTRLDVKVLGEWTVEIA